MTPTDIDREKREREEREDAAFNKWFRDRENQNIYWATSRMAWHARAAIAEKREVESEGKYPMSLGVGDGTSQLFVHGDYDSIKATQRIVFENGELRARVADLESALAASRTVTDEMVKNARWVWINTNGTLDDALRAVLEAALEVKGGDATATPTSHVDTAPKRECEALGGERATNPWPPKPVKSMTEAELLAEDRKSKENIDRITESDEELGGGSPLESFYERWNEVGAEIDQRTKPAPACPEPPKEYTEEWVREVERNLRRVAFNMDDAFFAALYQFGFECVSLGQSTAKTRRVWPEGDKAKALVLDAERELRFAFNAINAARQELGWVDP